MRNKVNQVDPKDLLCTHDCISRDYILYRLMRSNNTRSLYTKTNLTHTSIDQNSLIFSPNLFKLDGRDHSSEFGKFYFDVMLSINNSNGDPTIKKLCSIHNTKDSNADDFPWNPTPNQRNPNQMKTYIYFNDELELVADKIFCFNDEESVAENFPYHYCVTKNALYYLSKILCDSYDLDSPNSNYFYDRKILDEVEITNEEELEIIKALTYITHDEKEDKHYYYKDIRIEMKWDANSISTINGFGKSGTLVYNAGSDSFRVFDGGNVNDIRISSDAIRPSTGFINTTNFINQKTDNLRNENNSKSREAKWYEVLLGRK